MSRAKPAQAFGQDIFDPIHQFLHAISSHALRFYELSVDPQLQAGEALHRAELGELSQELAALHWLERILILELRQHQLQEVLLPQIAFGCRSRHTQPETTQCINWTDHRYS
jgi:hypothetical protein